MFYVVGDHVYETVLDERLGIYREVKVSIDANGVGYAVPMSTGATDKPKGRKLCTLSEICAQFGSRLTHYDNSEYSSELDGQTSMYTN